MKLAKTLLKVLYKLLALLAGTLAALALVFLGLDDILTLIKEISDRRKKKIITDEDMDAYTR